jgi:hypothetical protein
MRGPLLKKKSQRPKNFVSSFLAVFVGDSVTPMSTLAHNKRSCSKKWKKSGQNCVFPVFPAKILARFHVTPFSTLANIKGSLPTNSTTPDRLRWWAKTVSEEFPGFGGSKSSKTSFFKRPGI